MAHNIVSIDPVPEVEVLDATPSDTLPSFGRSRHRSNARNAGEMYLATLGSPASVRVVRSKLNCFARFFNYPDIQSCEWELMRYQNVVTFLDHLKSKLEIKQISVVTINAYISAIKGVAQTAWNLNQINDKDLMRIKSIRQLQSSRKIAGKALSITESSAFLSECTGDDQRIIRDRAILLLLLGCGLRRAEITNIEIKNVFLEEARIRLVGKGNKERDVFMNKVVLEAVSLWIEVRRNVISSWNDKYPWKSGNAGDGSSGYLFGRWTRHYRYLVVNKPINPATVAKVVSKYKSEAEIKVPSLKTVTTHDLRRTFATRLLENGVDIVIVRNLMGHSNISTTTLYDRRGDEAMRKATEKIIL